MPFLEADLDQILTLLNKLKQDSSPLWGSMSAQRMVEHLSDTVNLAMGNIAVELELPEDRIERAQAFIDSEHPMPKNFQVSFATEAHRLRNQSLEDAINEFSNKWKEFEAYFQQNSGATNLHPNFGNLNWNQWLRLHRKHITHHLEQFALIE